MLVLASPALLFVAWFYYSHHADDGSDLYYRISLTFNGLAGSSAWEMLMGNVNTEHANDSGLLSLTYNFGLIGVFLAIFYYSGLFTRRTGSNPSLFICFSLLATLTLMFGAALLSIKSASLIYCQVSNVSRENSMALIFTIRVISLTLSTTTSSLFAQTFSIMSIVTRTESAHTCLLFG